MTAEVHPPSGLSKATWTDADIEDMGWHDCRIHAISVGGARTTPCLRRDCFSTSTTSSAGWSRSSPLPHFTFWITPATLVFERAWSIAAEMDPGYVLLEIADLHRLDPPDDKPEPLWHIEGQNFDLRLRAPGFVQHLRQPPQHVDRQWLTLTQRGGLSFAEQSFG